MIICFGIKKKKKEHFIQIPMWWSVYDFIIKKGQRLSHNIWDGLSNISLWFYLFYFNFIFSYFTCFTSAQDINLELMLVQLL